MLVIEYLCLYTYVAGLNINPVLPISALQSCIEEINTWESHKSSRLKCNCSQLNQHKESLEIKGYCKQTVKYLVAFELG